MASTSETGHAKNVANFEELLSYCTGYGTAYNPTKPGITLTALNAKRTEAVNGLAVLNSALPALANAVNAREIMFEPLKKRVTPTGLSVCPNWLKCLAPTGLSVCPLWRRCSLSKC